MSGVYIHIPFCRQACHYCNFHFSTNLKPIDDLVSAISLELDQRKDYLKSNAIETVYFGGGTPSILSAAQLSRILESLNRHYDLTSVKEITLETNPEDINREKLKAYRKLGIDRLSIGFQSFDDQVLTRLNRTHNQKDSVLGFEVAREMGFDKISVDLIYGIPGRTHDAWLEDLSKVIKMGAEHISSYALTIEKRTALFHQVEKGDFQEPDDEFVASQFEMLLSETSKAGYEQYEISNFCKPGNEAVHNSNYWKGVHYVGIGPGAHSYNGNERQFNVENNTAYLKGVRENKSYFTLEPLSEVDKFNEYLLTSIRTKWGTNLKELGKLENAIDYDKIETFKKEGLILIKDNVLYLSDKGKLLADEITSQLIVV